MANRKLKAIYLQSPLIKLYNPSLGKFFPITREKLCELMNSGKLDARYHSVFEPEDAPTVVAKVEKKANITEEKKEA